MANRPPIEVPITTTQCTSKRRQDIEHVANIDPRVVVAPVRVVIRLAAAAVVGAHHPPLRGEPVRQVVEIAVGAGDSAETEHGRPRRNRIAVVANIEAQAVLRRDPAFAVRRQRLQSEKRREFGKRRDLGVGPAGQALGPLAEAVDPRNPEAEGAGGMGVPGVRRLV